MIGPFPPPRHGMSAINEAIETLAVNSGLSVLRYDTSPPSLNRTFFVRAGRWPRILKAVYGALNFPRKHPGATIYCSVSGGLGLLYDAVCILAARMGGAGELILHHHSFRYIDAPYLPMRLLTTIAGRRALHVVLDETMEALLQERYPVIGETLTVSNAGLLNLPLPTPHVARPLRTVGYLSNLSAAKGLNEILATAEACLELAQSVNFTLAGPFENARDETHYRERFARLKNVRYLGAVYGTAKEDFFLKIDAFLFPTRYRHEAEPLVVLEAMSYGRPVIAYARGCIPSLLIGRSGCVVSKDRNFASAAFFQLKAWLEPDEEFSMACAAASARFAELKQQSNIAKQELLKRLGKA